MEYAITLLQEHLDKELIYQAQALSFVNGASHGARADFLNQTTEAFRVSLDLADERITHLINAIEKLNKQD